MTLDFDELLASARRCNAAYVMNASAALAAFRALGENPLGQYQNADHQAVLCQRDAGRYRLSISGTRFSQLQVPDLFDDIAVEPESLGESMLVTAGALKGLNDMWRWVGGLVPAAAKIDVEGHSLGAWRTRYTPIFLPPKRIGRLISIESPKGANATYWAKYAAELSSLVSVVNGRDLWAGWPFLGPWCHPPEPFVWLTGGSYKMVTEAQWPGGRDLEDHDIANVIAALEVVRAKSLTVPA